MKERLKQSAQRQEPALPRTKLLLLGALLIVFEIIVCAIALTGGSTTSSSVPQTSAPGSPLSHNVIQIAEQLHRNVIVHSDPHVHPGVNTLTANEVVDLLDDVEVLKQVVSHGEGAISGGQDDSYSPPSPPADGMPDRAWIYDYLRDVERERQRGWMAHRIDCYFDARRSPMKGLGRYIVLSAERYGHDPRLCAAIAEAESTCGLACFSPHNAWGMLAYRSGFASWEQGVDAMFDWLYQYNGVCTSAPLNWCEPPDPWRSNVNKVMNSI